jgi:hypothetical protein
MQLSGRSLTCKLWRNAPKRSPVVVLGLPQGAMLEQAERQAKARETAVDWDKPENDPK